MQPQIKTKEGFLFDIYNVEEEIHIWLLDNENKPCLFLDNYYPIIYLHGDELSIRKIIKRIQEYKALKEIPEKSMIEIANKNLQILVPLKNRNPTSAIKVTITLEIIVVIHVP